MRRSLLPGLVEVKRNLSRRFQEPGWPITCCPGEQRVQVRSRRWVLVLDEVLANLNAGIPQQLALVCLQVLSTSVPGAAPRASLA